MSGWRKSLLSVSMIFLLVSPVAFTLVPPSSQAGSPKVSSSLLLSGAPLQRIIVEARGPVGPLQRLMGLSYTLGQTSSSYLAFGVANRSSILGLASLPQVLKVLPDVQLQYNDSRLDAVGGGMLQSDMFRIRNILGAAQVNSQLGINGSGVRVAVVDSGTDFGNPQLSGAVARDQNGVPMALDPDGTGIVLTNATFTSYSNSSGVFLNMRKNASAPRISVYLGAAGYPNVVQSFNWTLPDYRIGSDPQNYIVSQSGVYHFGTIFESTPGGYALFPALVVDSKVAGAYDTVYVDFKSAPLLSSLLLGGAIRYNVTADFSFWGAAPHHVGDGTETLTADFNGDGVPDISAGLLGARVLDVFGAVSSGKSSYNYDLGALNGSLLAPMDPYGNYFGVMYDFEGHGTQTASNVASSGTASYDIYGNGTRYHLEGVAPGAKILAVKALYIGDVLYGWMWSSGFDYNGTSHSWQYTGRHRAQIVSNSWGVSSWPIMLSGLGYDVVSVLEDALSVPGSFSPSYPGTLFVQAMGNGGPGYGTITDPASSSFALSVGASTSWHTAQQFSAQGIPYYGGPSSYHDDVISWSDRGPGPVGDPKPDVVNVGAFGFTPTAIMSANGNGSEAWGYFGGTSQATPLTAGVAALVTEALASKGRPFTPAAVKDIIMSTSVDTGNDAFVQGAGRVDALSAVSYALGGSSLNRSVFSVSTDSSYANLVGSLGGAEAALSQAIGQNVTIPSAPQPSESWFAGYVDAGSSSTASFTVTNPTSSAVSVSLNSSVYQLMGHVSFSNSSIPGESRYINLTRAAGRIPKGADLMVVRETFPFSSWDNATASPNYADAVTRLRLQVYNWNDTNHDGVPALGEIALVNTNYAWANTEEVRISQPGAKFTSTPLIGVYQNDNLTSYWFGPTTTRATPVNFTVDVYYLRKVPWNWLSLGSSSLEVPARSNASFSASVSVPPSAGAGIYEGFVTLSGNNSQLTEVPVSVSVPIQASQKGLPYTFGGGNSTSGTLYENGMTYGATDFSWRYESGNWRYYRVLVTDPTANQGTARVQWSSPQTSINLFVMDPQGRIVASSVPPGLYKSITRNFVLDIPVVPSPSNDYLGVSPYNGLGWGGGFAPSANDGPTSSVVQFPVNGTGLYTLVVHTTVYGGQAPSESFSGEVSLQTLLPIGSPPSLSVGQPSGPVSGSVTLPLQASGENISSVSYSVDGSSPSRIPPSSTSLSIDTTGLSDGNHSVTVQVSDVVGHVTAKTVSFFVLNHPPSVLIGNPAQNETVNGNVAVVFNVDGPYVTHATLSIDGSAYDVTGRNSLVWNSSSLPDGSYSLVLTATNAAGKNASASVTFRTDNQAVSAQQLGTRTLSAELTYSIGLVVVLAVVVAIMAVRRRR